MLEKIEGAVWEYCFTILEVFCAFFERTHTAVGIGMPLLAMIAAHLFLPVWIAAGVAAFILAPAAAAMVAVIVEGVLLEPHSRS